MAKAKSKTKAKSEPEVQAIPTIYAGIEFRSRLEASVAQFFNKLGWNWEYEPKSFLLPSGVHYRPDFYVKRRIRNLWVECRGYTTEKGERQINEFPEVLTDLGLNDWYLVLHSGEEYGCTVSGAGGALRLGSTGASRAGSTVFLAPRGSNQFARTAAVFLRRSQPSGLTFAGTNFTSEISPSQTGAEPSQTRGLFNSRGSFTNRTD